MTKCVTLPDKPSVDVFIRHRTTYNQHCGSPKWSSWDARSTFRAMSKAETSRCTSSVVSPAQSARLSGHEGKGFRLGKLYVDDAQIVAKEFPNGELRGVW